MSILNTLLSEKKAERKQHLAKAEVLAKQINDLEAEIKVTKLVTKPVTKPKPAAKPTKPAAKKAGKTK